MATAEPVLDIIVAYASAAREVCEIPLRLPAGSTLGQALRASGLGARFPQLDLDQAPTGVWGRKATRSQVLRDRDRVEIYQPLRVDPKVARRERFAQQGTRGAGLFAKRRAGAKAGY